MAVTVPLLEFCAPPVPGETHKYYGSAHNNFLKLPQFTGLPKPVVVSSKTGDQQQKTLHAVASSGNLGMLKQILSVLQDPLKAVNDPHPSTGLTPLHFAASRGHLEVVKCLLEDYAVSVDSRDKEGETALLKAAYAGHYHVVQYLLSKNANIHQKDKDGWTALHNACSRGYLPIVRLLVENNARVDARSKMNHTPLINAASKGYMSIVEYLLDEAHANPLLKNNFGEAAYDVSAAAGESYICEMLERAGQSAWRMEASRGDTSFAANYDLLEFHVTVMVVLHENQRATSLLGISRPQFSAQALTKYDTRGPWSLYGSGTPCSKNDVSLPKTSQSGMQKWFWLTDWQIDYSDPRIDPTSGWQYARSFDENGDGWTPVAPTAGFSWVRRRRWVRVMKRRMDLTNGAPPTDGTLDNDYLYQAEEIVQTAKSDTPEVPDTVASTISRLTHEVRSYEEAVQLLLAGIKTDYNQHRKHQALILQATYSGRIDQLTARISSLAPKLATSMPTHQQHHHEELARELGFVQPKDMTSTTTSTAIDANPWSPDNGENWQEQEDASLNQVDLAGQAEDGPRSYDWESDIDARDCRRCSRKFGFLVRRHHCRRCGLIVCDRCSNSRAYLSPSQILQDPSLPQESRQVLASQHQRVCDKCYADLGI